MNRYKVRLAPSAQQDLERVYQFLLNKDEATAQLAMQAIEDSYEVLARSPFICRKAGDGSHGPLLRELIIDFGSSGYLALFEIEDDQTITITAVRHQLESDYH